MAARRGAGGDAPFPRSLLVVGIPLAATVLIVFFVYLGFPYDQVAMRVVAEARRSGIELSIQQVGPKLQLAGPGIEATGVRVQAGTQTLPPFDRALLRPAWSLAWLRGRPALSLRLESPVGGADGTLVVSEHPSWTGDLFAIDLARLPLPALSQAGLRGTADAHLDLSMAAAGIEGPLDFDARDGSLQLPNMTLAIPYERLQGELVLGGDSYAEVKSLVLEGPLLSANITGTVGRAENLGAAPLRLEAEISAQQNMAAALKAVGMRVGKDGKAKVRIDGTVGRPRYR